MPGLELGPSMSGGTGTPSPQIQLPDPFATEPLPKIGGSGHIEPHNSIKHDIALRTNPQRLQNEGKDELLKFNLIHRFQQKFRGKTLHPHQNQRSTRTHRPQHQRINQAPVYADCCQAGLVWTRFREQLKNQESQGYPSRADGGCCCDQEDPGNCWEYPHC